MSWENVACDKTKIGKLTVDSQDSDADTSMYCTCTVAGIRKLQYYHGVTTDCQQNVFSEVRLGRPNSKLSNLVSTFQPKM